MLNRKKASVLTALIAVAGAAAACEQAPPTQTQTPGEPVFAAIDTTFSNNPNLRFRQVERLGNPLAMEVFVEKREHETHDISEPRMDPGHFTDDYVWFITNVAKRDTAYAMAIAGALLGTDKKPGDMIRVYTNRAAGVTAANSATSGAVGWLTYVLDPVNGYGGRKLMNDDAVDKGAAAVFGSLLGNTNNVSPGLVTDNVDANDKPALNTFPYLAAPNAASAVGGAAGTPVFPVIQLPAGYKIEKVAEGLNFPTGVTWDDQNRMYVLEGGGAFFEEPPPVRILRVEPGRLTQVARFEKSQIGAAAVGFTFYNGNFYLSHRDPEDRTGAVSRVSPTGQMTRILSGILDSQAEHQVNGLRVGPDGRMYLAAGPATNAGVVGIDLAPWVSLSPTLKSTPCKDIVLTGINYLTPDFRTKEDESDVVMTGAFVPFGTPTSQGQKIPGTKKCGGSILVFDPNNAEATVRPFAFGLRNIIDIAWNKQGEMFADVNGYDVRGSRPFNDKFDPTYRIRENTWYGYPDFSAAFEPATDPKFDVPDALQPGKFLNNKPLPKDRLHFVIDHAASGLQRPDGALIAGLHEINSSPSGLDVIPASFFGAAEGQLLIAQWGDLTPPTNPLRNGPTGSQIVRLDPSTRQIVPFASNAKPGPASEQGAPGMGLERPFAVRFGPDGALYIVDFGVVRINRADAGPGDDPYEFAPRTGMIWKITRTGS